MFKKVLFVLGGGIGNIIQAIPAVRCLAESGLSVDLFVECDSTKSLEIFKTKYVNKIISRKPEDVYDVQLNGPFTSGQKYRSRQFLKSRINYAQHIPETEVYADLVRQLGIQCELKDTEINCGFFNHIKIQPNTVAIYPGCKSNWPMKRWDKYDLLAKKFNKVLLVGSKEDIYSHGNPPWIKKNWNWPENTTPFTGSLQEVSYAISQCKFFIGNDGGLSHVAAATGIPTFVLFGPSSHIKNKPFSKKCFSISINLRCSPCQFKLDTNNNPIFDSGKCDCPFKIKCMKDMSVDFVFEKINSILNELH